MQPGVPRAARPADYCTVAVVTTVRAGSPAGVGGTCSTISTLETGRYQARSCWSIGVGDLWSPGPLTALQWMTQSRNCAVLSPTGANTDRSTTEVAGGFQSERPTQVVGATASMAPV